MKPEITFVPNYTDTEFTDLIENSLSKFFVTRSKDDGTVDHDNFFICNLSNLWGAVGYGWPDQLITRKLENPNTKLFGYLHDGSWNIGSIKNLNSQWYRYFEFMLFNLFDIIFVASNWHKYLIVASLDLPDELSDKIKIVGYPLKKKDPSNRDFNQLTILFDTVDQYEQAIDLLECLESEEILECFKNVHLLEPGIESRKMSILKKRIDFLNNELDLTVVSTETLNLNDPSVIVSMKLEDSFDSDIAKAILWGAHPILPNLSSYPELVENRDRYLYEYGNLDSLVDKIEEVLGHESPPYRYVEKHYESASNIARTVRENMED